MRTSRNLQLYSIIFLFLSTFTAAWPWPRWLPELDVLIVRQDSGNGTTAKSAAATTGKATGKASSFVPTPTKTLVSAGKTTTLFATEAPSATEGSDANKTTATGHTSYDARLPAGGVSMLTPAAISGQQYFKVGDFVTFGWNYTSLKATPTAVNVMATCTQNQQLYTIAANVTVANATNAVTWDTGGYQATAVTDPLLTNIYTLVIYDAESSISATAEAGYLAVQDTYTFGMYVPQSYTPLSDFICATCNGALGPMEKRALGMMLGMCMLTALSFGWFVNGLGVIW